MSEQTNRLIHATSPYLLQHAHNPVDWHEWGAEALAKAKSEDKPILVSIGYSSCHWCHVMERECFENRDLADLMNEFFVCIKIDREERPDLDQLYMEAVQAMGVNGGWPLNVFLTPEQKPFYGGTYFQPQAWAQVLRGLHEAYRSRRTDVEASAASLAEALAASDVERFMQRVNPLALRDEAQAVYEKLSAGFDTAWGGMDKAPKFVMPSVWMLVMRYHHLTHNTQAHDHLMFTLHKIAMGGIYDQIGGGFARYSVDREWFAPHFEKMLYDNAQLFTLYADAYALDGNAAFRTVLDETFDWLSREMTHPDGAFYSALDADSEGAEGKYYIWRYDELEQTLGDHAPAVASYYSASRNGNWEHGANILSRRTDDAAFLTQHGLEQGKWHTQLREVKQRLLDTRDKRIKPGLDDKILTAWNAMAITGLVSAYKATQDMKFLNAATRCMNFLQRHMMDGVTLYRSYKNRRSETIGFLDDYAFVIQAQLQLYQVTFDETLLTQAKSLLLHVVEAFYDPNDGYFFYTSSQAEKLIARKKEVFDNVIPSSNAVMAQNLFHLGTLLDNDEWKGMAKHMVDNLGQLIMQEPHYMSYWAMVKWEIARGLHEVMFVGPGSRHLMLDYMQHFQPYSVRLGTERSSALSLLAEKQSDRAAIFVCHNKVCQLPVTTVAEALKMVL